MCDLKKIDKCIVYNFQRIVSKQLTIYSNQASFGFYSSCFLEKKILIFVQEIYFLIKKYFCIPNREIGRLVLTFSKSTIFRNVCWIFNNLILAYYFLMKMIVFSIFIWPRWLLTFMYVDEYLLFWGMLLSSTMLNI